MRKTLSVILIIVLLVSSAVFFQKEVKNFFYQVSAPVQNFFWKIGNNTSDFFKGVGKTNELNKENEELRLKAQSLLAENASLKEIEKENEFLREALGLDLEKEFDLTMADVISKDPFQDIILINKGLKDGVKTGSPVILQEKIIIGKIGEVFDKFSKVVLISDKKNSFDIKISDSETYGIIRGQGNFGLLLDLVPKDNEIKEGDLIITTPLGGIYPKNLLVGTIKNIKKTDTSSFQQAEIEASFELKELKTVFIINNF